jgi:hypothetical protein
MTAYAQGAGHFVPLDRAGPALQMIANFVWNTQNYTEPTGISTTPGKIDTSTMAATTTTGRKCASSLHEFSFTLMILFCSKLLY